MFGGTSPINGTPLVATEKGTPAFSPAPAGPLQEEHNHVFLPKKGKRWIHERKAFLGKEEGNVAELKGEEDGLF